MTQLRVQPEQETAELIHIVLQGRPRHKDQAIRQFCQLPRINTSLGLGIFYIMGLIHHHQINGKLIREHLPQFIHRLIVADRYASLFNPDPSGLIPAPAMNDQGRKAAVLANFPLPVDQESGRAGDQKMSLISPMIILRKR